MVGSIMIIMLHTAQTLALAQPVTDYLSVALAAALFWLTYKKYIKPFAVS